MKFLSEAEKKLEKTRIKRAILKLLRFNSKGIKEIDLFFAVTGIGHIGLFMKVVGEMVDRGELVSRRRNLCVGPRAPKLRKK